METKWNADSALEYLLALLKSEDLRYQHRFETQEKELSTAFKSAEKAIELAEANAERWRKNADEWRAFMSEQEKSFVSSKEHTALKERVDRSEGGTQSKKELWARVLAFSLFLVAVIEAVIQYTHKV